MKPIVAAALAVLWVALFSPSAHGGEPTLGEHHPEVRLPTIDGRDTVSLHAQRGTKILLIQFASW